MIDNWISVKDRLPENENPVLVFGGKSIYTAVYGNRGPYKNRWWKLNSKTHYCNPTHWMPLPNRPNNDTINQVESLNSIVLKEATNDGEFDECDQLVCSNCGIELQGWVRVERDEDDGEETHHEYVFRYCPNCGAKIIQ